MIAAIVLRPEIDPARNPISEYAIGRLGWLAVLGFQASAAAYACLAAALRDRLRDRVGRIGLFMLCYCALATAVVGLCVADPVTTPMSALTATGRVHVVAGISAFVVLPVAAVAINMSLSRTAVWAGSRRLLLVTGLLPTIGFVTLVALVAIVTPAEGWPPRLMFLTYAAWTIAIAIKSVELTSSGLEVPPWCYGQDGHRTASPGCASWSPTPGTCGPPPVGMEHPLVCGQGDR